MGAVDTAPAITAALADEWEDLAGRTSATPFDRPGWIEAWCRAFGAGAFQLLLLRRGQRLAGVLPLQRRHGLLVSTTNWHTPSFAPLAEDDDALAELLGAALARSRIRLDLCFLDDRVAETCRRAAQPLRRPLLVRVVQRAPYLRIDGDWDGYEASLPSRRTGKYRRFRRRLDEQGEVSFEVADGGERLGERLREGFEVEAAGFQRARAGGTAILASAATTGFYTDVAEWAAPRGWLRLWTLRLNGEAIAFAYGLEHDGVYYDLKVGFDPRYARFGPGVLLMREQIRSAFAGSLERFEFLGGADRHKLAWTDAVHDRIRVQAFAPNPAGALDRLMWERGRPVAKRLGGAMRRAEGA
jgi:CelD/BcsL family acetyltransferase involved in cellulose biosynthesis